jgi:hypothetical protein
MRAMEGMGAEQMKAMVPLHRQMVASMLSSFADSLQRMNMSSDPARTALRDAIRKDMILMPDLNATQ